MCQASNTDRSGSKLTIGTDFLVYPYVILCAALPPLSLFGWS